MSDDVKSDTMKTEEGTRRGREGSDDTEVRTMSRQPADWLVSYLCVCGAAANSGRPWTYPPTKRSHSETVRRRKRDDSYLLFWQCS